MYTATCNAATQAATNGMKSLPALSEAEGPAPADAQDQGRKVRRVKSKATRPAAN